MYTVVCLAIQGSYHYKHIPLARPPALLATGPRVHDRTFFVRFAMLVGGAFAVLVLTRLDPVAANGFCGGFDLDNHGQAGQCLSDDNSRNGAVLIPPAEEVQA